MDNIPEPDNEFDHFQSNFRAKTEADHAKFGLTDTNKSNMQTLSDAWQAKYAADIVAQNAARAAKQEKNTARQALEAELRRDIKKVYASETVTNDDLAALNLPQRDTVKTRANRPSTIPIVRIDFSLHLQHKVYFVDSATPLKKKKPDKYRGVQVYMKIGGPPPADYRECFHAGFDTNSPYFYSFQQSDLGKTVYYILFWENTRGEMGNPSEIYSAVVG
ncbi:MAG: hypothetical protein HY960_03325 [Ignavibacteriae bacterium]|nr:hypothetical protein [Ignavibacteriota bacterium]